ncbi:cobyrinate a,c-diamide synthase [Synechocystis sp. CACIAM 05]|uniref:cobyrinate a,c-diamide synthase n=1 Tax=Synechocystis sp. CACIAM 05 TaxID=1933929 RepID=UPI00138E80E6|nr:cobyrinate a,c-diamide synthase [Synechocystis sp. CACIAM 05]QHU99079.1 cobyrinic acid a,c-diamide synthase [Synechocystis sp. CACIAM 05]
MTVIIAGERSGAGKTTITLAMLAYLARQKLRVQSFKVGPDYIDPMFHSQITGRPCRNLDPFLTSEAYVQRCFHYHSQGTPYSLIEGVMGLFDGVPYQGLTDYSSTAHIARLLHLPIVFVVDCQRLSGSVAAIVQGYRHWQPEVNLVGVILNRVGGDRHLELLKVALEPLHIPILGVFFRQQDLTLPDRHLGLVPCGELPQIQQYFDQLAHVAAQQLDWPKLLPLLETPRNLPSPMSLFDVPQKSPQARLAIAQDQAFNFYYADNLDLLTHCGFELIPFSPLEDTELPPAIDGVYLGGGFPELFAETLSLNQQLKNQFQQLINQGLPIYGECGGLMYLSQAITDFTGQTFSMVGILPTTVTMGGKLSLGYRQAQVVNSHSWLWQTESLRGHEFHRSQMTKLPNQALYRQRGLLVIDQEATDGWCVGSVQASYLHLHWGSQISTVEKFRAACLAFQKKLSYLGECPPFKSVPLRNTGGDAHGRK